MDLKEYHDKLMTLIEKHPQEKFKPTGSIVAPYFLNWRKPRGAGYPGQLSEGYKGSLDTIYGGVGVCHGGLIGLPFNGVDFLSFGLPEYTSRDGNNFRKFPKEDCELFYQMLLTHPLYAPLLEGYIRSTPKNYTSERPMSWLSIPTRVNTMWIAGQFAVTTRFIFERTESFEIFLDLVKNHGADPWKTMVMTTTMLNKGNQYRLYNMIRHGTPTDVVPKSGFLEVASEKYKRNTDDYGAGMSRMAFANAGRWDKPQGDTAYFFGSSESGELLKKIIQETNTQKNEKKKISSRFSAVRSTREDLEEERLYYNIENPKEYVHKAYDTMTGGKI